MSMTITDDMMISDLTSAAARFRPGAAADGGAAWVAKWLPARLLTRNQAITAMVLAEEVATWDGRPDGKTWLFIQAHADELSLLVDAAVGCLNAYDQRD